VHRVSFTLPSSIDSAREARRIVDGLPLDAVSEAHFNLRLLVTELVTNSVRHAGLGEGDNVSVEIRIVGGAIRVEVTDPGDGFTPPANLDIASRATGGRGLCLVDALADRWGIATAPGQARVWFEFDA